MFNRAIQLRITKPSKNGGAETPPTVYVSKAALADYERFTESLVKEIGKGIALCIVLHGVTKVAVALAEK